jgi:hypothetical protein
VAAGPDAGVERLVGLNFRDEKTVTAYAFLLLAATEIGQGRIGLPLPKWRRMASGKRDSTPRLIGALRSQLWGREAERNRPIHACLFNKTGFVFLVDTLFRILYTKSCQERSSDNEFIRLILFIPSSAEN